MVKTLLRNWIAFLNLGKTLGDITPLALHQRIICMGDLDQSQIAYIILQQYSISILIRDACKPKVRKGAVLDR